MTFDVGESRQCQEVLILEDDLFEATESFFITVANTSPSINVNETAMFGASVEDTTGGMNHFIIDTVPYSCLIGVEIVLTDLFLVVSEDDSRCFNVCALVADLPAGGLACDQVVVIETENNTAGKSASTVDYMLQNFGHAVEDMDYQPRLVTINIDNTAEINATFCTEIEINELIVDDGLLESNESFQLIAVSPEALIGLSNTLLVTILDDDGMATLRHLGGKINV